MKNSISLLQPFHDNSGISKRQKRKQQVDFETCNNSDIYKRAKEVQACLAQEFPSQIRIMLPSHVSGGFWLHLPRTFSDVYLPEEDVIMTLEDENGKIYNVKYLWERTALSAGWRLFANDHKLLSGDAVIFQLVGHTKFKVHIVRSTGIDGVINPYKHIVEKELNNYEAAKDDHITGAADNKQVLPKLESALDDVVSEVYGQTGLEESVIAPKELGSMEDFEIVINDLVGDLELSKLVRAKYYELCCSQQLYLHEHLLQGLNYKLVSGIICETVFLADAISACEIITSIEDFFIWGQSLKAFEDLGMNVGFLRARLDQLVYLAVKLKMHRESRSIGTFEVKPLQAKEAVGRPYNQTESLEKDCSELELAFEEVKNAPW